jgi:signal transduction histidine kinase
MYAKYMVYLPFEGESYSVMGIVVVIFVIALDLKVNLTQSILFFFAPLLAIVIAIVFFTEIPESKVVNFTNLFPMTIIGFVANRVNYNLRYKLIKSNHQLSHEKLVTKELYEETLAMNEYLQEKNLEVYQQKRAVQKANEELQKMSRTKDKFFSIISHDLKTPFNAMVGFSNLLSEHYESYTQEEQRKFISIIDQSVNNTYKLLNNLLEWAQAQSDSDTLTLETTNLFLLSNDIIGLLKQTAENKNISLRCDVDQELEIDVDTNKLTTIIRNLVTNAIKFTHKGGEVSVQAETVKSLDGQQMIQISVCDTGIGIAPDKQEKLFNLGEKISSPGTDKEVGTGLGLILCEEFVKRHGGKIWVESEINKGSKFIFTLPYKYKYQLN